MRSFIFSQCRDFPPTSGLPGPVPSAIL